MQAARSCTLCGGDHDPSQPCPDPLVGQSIGNYQVVRLLGVGGFGAVYEAAHPDIGSRVAVKVLHTQFSRDKQVVERFVNEARAANLVAHDNIVRIFDFGRLGDGRQYCVMEFLEGEALAALLAAGAAPLGVAGPILLQLCDALGRAHERGIVHRDLKPDNIYLITRNYRRHFVKIVDFGIAKLRVGGAGLTQSGMALGTPVYMSPEQAAGHASEADARTDIYSLGVIMFQMATGRAPFTQTSALQLLLAHAREPPPAPRSIDPAIPQSLESAILRCLEKRPEDRFQTMGALAQAIAASMTGEGVSFELPLEEGAAVPSSAPGMVTPGGVAIRTPEPEAWARTMEDAHAAAGGTVVMRVRTPRETPLAPPTVQATPQRSGGRTRLVLIGAVLVALAAAAAVVVGRGSPPVSPAPLASAAPPLPPTPAPAPPPPAVPATVKLRVTSAPAGAAVRAQWAGGSVALDHTPGEIEAPRGAAVELVFTLADHAPARLDASADASKEVRAELRPLKPRSPSAAPQRKWKGRGLKDIDL